MPIAAEFLDNNSGQFSYPLSPRFSPLHPLGQLSATTVQVCFSVTDFTKDVKRQMSKNITITSNGAVASTHLEETSGVLRRNSPSKMKRAVLRKVSNGSGENSTSRIVEVWEDGLLEVSLDVTNLHGDFYADGRSSFEQTNHLRSLICL